MSQLLNIRDVRFLEDENSFVKLIFSRAFPKTADVIEEFWNAYSFRTSRDVKSAFPVNLDALKAFYPMLVVFGGRTPEMSFVA